MCGINGLYFFNEPAVDASEVISLMNESIRHRGPDDFGVWNDPHRKLYLGHRRLSIIDLSEHGHQPMVLPDGTAIVFNGEIYNFRELKSRIKNFQFKSDSDTELLLALYLEMGESLLNEIEGMFAFAIWDPRKQGLFLARDRVGKKPLYFSSYNDCFSFSSEIRALLTLPWMARKLDEKALYYFLSFGFTPSPWTMFQGIQKLEPGTCMWVNVRGIGKPRPFWSVKFEHVPDNENELVDILRESLNRSMDLRMVSDVPVGVFLSGGVDSTAIATLMKERAKGQISSFSIGFEGKSEYDESSEARATALRLGFTHHERIVGQHDMKRLIERVVDVFDEPLADPTCIPIYFLTEMARESGTKVVLTGDGPDELLLGYRNWRSYIRTYPWYNAYCKLPDPIKNSIYSASRYLIKSEKVYEILSRGALNQELFWGYAPSFKESVKKRLLSTSYREKSSQWNCHDIIRGFRNEYNSKAASLGASDPNWMAYLGLCFVIPNYYLHRADRLGMYNSIELRAPLLDSHFVNMALSIPHQWKLRNGEPKYILKRALNGIVPDDVLYRKKRGFCVPLRDWGGEIMEDYIMSNLDGFCNKTDIFNKDAILSVTEDYRKGDLNSVNNLWNVYYIMAWMNRWKLA